MMTLTVLVNKLKTLEDNNERSASDKTGFIKSCGVQEDKEAAMKT